MPRAIITEITDKGTTHRVSRVANEVLTDLQGKILKKRLVVQVFNKDTKRRGSFFSFPKKSFVSF